MIPTCKEVMGGTMALAAGLTAAAAQQTGEDQRPNIVLIIADDCRYLDLGCYGSPDAITPNIDRLASEGVRFTNFFQASAMSSPTRHCLLTGLYPVSNGAYPNHTFIYDWVETLPSYLNRSGYRVATQGKRHYAPLASFPFEYLDGIDYNGPVDVFPEKIEPFIADAAENGDPFFLFVASTDPHSPWTRGDQSLFEADKLQLPPNLVDNEWTRKQFGNYLAEINLLDQQVGWIDGMIEKYGLTDNTVFIFTSEQGYSFPFAKWTCYDAGLQTAFVIRWPGVVEPGTQAGAMCEYVDVTPTFIEIAGGQVPDGLDGRSFLPVILGQEDHHKDHVYGIQTSRSIINGPEYYGIRSVRDDRFTYIVNLTPEAEFQCQATNNKIWEAWLESARTDSFARRQVDAYITRPAEELYDNQTDPFQMNNLAGDPAYAARKKALREKLEAWMEQQGDKGQETEMAAYDRVAARQGVK